MKENSQYIIRFQNEEQRNVYHRNIKKKGWPSTNMFNQILANNPKLIPQNPLKNI